MLTHVVPHQPPHLEIPKYLPDYSSHLSRPKLVNTSYFADPSHSFSASLSPVQPESPATVEDDLNSPHSPSSGSGNYHYADRNSGSFNSPVSPAGMYDNPHGVPYSGASHSYHPPPPSQGNYDLVNSSDTMRGSQLARPYVSESPSPVDPHPSSYPQIMSATHPQDRQSQISVSYQPSGDRFDAQSEIESDRYARGISADKYSTDNNAHSQSSALLDHRRMSEPAILAAPNPYASQSCDTHPLPRIQTQFNFNNPAINVPRSSAYAHSLHRGASIGSLRDLRHAHLDYPAHPQPPYQGWKDDYHGDDGFDGPISPLQPDFSGGVDSPTSGLPYSPTTENHYGPSPPGTGTSTTSSAAPLVSPSAPPPLGESASPAARDSGNKTYSFVALPGNTVKKRPRRRYDEIERLYQCSWPDCTKAYGTLNHLNAHVTMQKHGPKRSPNEFKELRKQWRKAKKEASPGPLRRTSLSVRHDSHDYNGSRSDSNNDSSTPLYTRQPSYQSSAGLPSSAPSIFTEHGDRYSVPVEVDHRQGDARDDLAAYGAHARERYGGSAPASWHSPTRVHTNYSYLSSSLPSQPTQSFSQHNNLPSLNVHVQYQPQPQQPPPRPQSPLVQSATNRLPPDSTLLTPLPGYQPPSLLAPMQGSDNVSYPSEPVYKVYTDSHDGRQHTGHGT
ncbi:putative zinc finger [Lyophyllum shimeji]|uniref:Zinc finger n=1 Tax=Lyophyllum shimeji TaxID=47721 RepID=A0A9P3PTM5_LYOSH|nr:putative zinc finger [Lyophyllum shimeji]